MVGAMGRDYHCGRAFARSRAGGATASAETSKRLASVGNLNHDLRPQVAALRVADCMTPRDYNMANKVPPSYLSRVGRGLGSGLYKS